MITHSSDPPSPWAGYQRCLTNLPDCTHIAILQDDTVPVPGFASAITMIASANPDTPVCLFLGRLPRDASRNAERAMKRGNRYITLVNRSNAFMPVVAVLWPRHKAEEFLAWSLEFPTLFGRENPRSDDAMAGRWKLRAKQTVVACVPSIVEHPDVEASLIGKQSQWGSQGRVAHLLADDAAGYDWSTA